MKNGEWTLRSRRVVTPSGTRAADVLIRNETIAALLAYDDPDSEGVILDAGELVVLPGLIALQGAGSSALEELGCDSVTRNCGAGGVTTLIDLPPRLDLDPVEDSAYFRRRAAEGKIRVDCGLVVLLGHGQVDRIDSWIETGFLGVEAILGDRSAGSAPPSTEADLRAAMPILAELDRPLIVDSGRIARSAGPRGAVAPFGSALPEREFAAIRLLIRLCRETRCRVHLIQPSASEALPMIAEARSSGLPITVETCPSHLGVSPLEVVDGKAVSSLDPTRRGFHNRNRLWEALESGLIDGIGPDFDGSSPADLDRKPGEDLPASIGTSPIRLTLPAVWAEARGRGFALDHLARWLAGRTAQVLGLEGRKGSIAPGLDADFVVFDPDVPTSTESRLLAGQVEATILRGTMIFQGGQFFEHPRGSVVLRLEETQPIPGTDGS